MRPVKYWCIVASKDHVKTGLQEGIAQACHGKAAPLRRMRPGDYVVFYSGKTYFGKPDKCQAFTAVGMIADEEVYQFRMSEDFCPFRRKVNFFPSKDLPIVPLIPALSFIQNKKNWGYSLRFGFFELSHEDFGLISSHMLAVEP